jgi:hypothetical protein
MTMPSLRIVLRRIRPLLIVTLLAAGAAPAAADSKYGLVFLGEKMSSGDVRAISLGSEMQLVADSLALQYNPATLADKRKFTFGICGYISTDRGRSEELAETDVSSKISSLVFGFPITSRVSLGVGYRGLYDAKSNFVITKETENGEQYGEFYNRTGGLTSFPFLAAVNVFRFLHVGGYFSVERGTYENRWDIIFADPTVNPANSTQTWNLRGTAYGFGVVLLPTRGLSVGVTYDSRKEYDTEVQERFTNPSSNSDSTQTTVVPERWTFSAAWRFHPSFAVYGTYTTSDFTRFEGLAFPQDRLYRENAASFGFEYPRGVPIGRARFPLRLGASYTQLPYSTPTGERLETLMATLGVGLKLRNRKGKIDLAFQFGVTGDLPTNLIEDRLFRIYLGVSGAEVWQRHAEPGF